MAEIEKKKDKSKSKKKKDTPLMDLNELGDGEPIQELSEEEENMEDETHTGDKSMKIMQLVLIIIILLVLGFAIFLVVRWQKGINLIITEDDLTEDYDIESEDFYCVFDPTEDPEYVDDGEVNIVIMGDDSIFYTNDEDGIPAQIAQKTDANVTALALPGSTIAVPGKGFSTEKPESAFSFYYLALCMSGGLRGSYELQESAIGYMDEPAIYQEYLDTLRQIEFDNVDILIVQYGLSDYLAGIQNVGDNVYSAHPYGDIDSFSGAFYLALQALKERYPHMQIIVSGPSYSIFTTEDGEKIGGEIYNTGNGTLGEYVLFLKQITLEQRCSFVDNYFGSDFNIKTHEEYLEDNGIYPNSEGNEIIAEHLISFFYFNR